MYDGFERREPGAAEEAKQQACEEKGHSQAQQRRVSADVGRQVEVAAAAPEEAPHLPRRRQTGMFVVSGVWKTNRTCRTVLTATALANACTMK